MLMPLTHQLSLVANSAAASVTLLPLSSEIIEKDIGAALTATGGTVTGVPVAFTN